MEIPLDEVVYFDAISSSSTGAAADADSTPTFAVYEESTDTDIGVGGNMTKRTSLTGNYRGSFTASAANGFELGKWYSVIGSATVGGVACKGVLRSFRVVAAENTAGYPPADAVKVGGQTASAAGTVTFPGTIASTTNITAGTITVVTTLTNLPAVTANWLTAAGIAADAITAAKIADGAIDAATFAAGAITAASIAADAITDAKVAADVTIASVTGTVGGVAGTTQTLDALQTALNSTHGAGSWATATGFSTLDAAGVRTAVGLASANLDTQLAAKQATFTSATGVTFPTNFSSLSISSGGLVKVQSGVTKNTALAGFGFYLVLSSDHVSAAAGKTVTATRSLDGAAFGACANAVTELSNGIYTINLAAADLNANVVILRFTASGCDDRVIEIVTSP